MGLYHRVFPYFKRFLTPNGNGWGHGDPPGVVRAGTDGAEGYHRYVRVECTIRTKPRWYNVRKVV